MFCIAIPKVERDCGINQRKAEDRFIEELERRLEGPAIWRTSSPPRTLGKQQFDPASHNFLKLFCADKCAPASKSMPDKNAQNIRLTEIANGPYTSPKFRNGRAMM